jgi:hypothetical protein
MIDMKTKFSLVMILIMFLLLSGCGGNTKTTQTPTMEPPSTSVNEAYPVPNESPNVYPGPQSQSTSVNPPENIQLVPTGTPDRQRDFVIISNVFHSETGLETIEITNISDQTQDINGYSLLIPSTGEHVNIFDVILDPGKSYNVYNGPGAQEQTDGEAWLDTPILQQTGDEIILLNRPGRVIWTYIYYP